MQRTTYLKLEPELLTEHQEQCDLVSKVLDNIVKYPELAALYAVPNGGWRNKTVALKLLQEGVKPGVPDLMLPVMRGGYGGLYIEMKRIKKGTVGNKQKAWHCWLAAQGYQVVVCKGAATAWITLLSYLALPPPLNVCVSRRELLEMAIELLPDWAALAQHQLKQALDALPSA